MGIVMCYLFFFQAEDGIRDKLVTGVQTCALPISGIWRILDREIRVKPYRLKVLVTWARKRSAAPTALDASDLVASVYSQLSSCTAPFHRSTEDGIAGAAVG